MEMPSEKCNILEFNQYMKSDKMPCIIYTDIESSVKIDGCASNSEKSSIQQQVSIFLVDIQSQLYGLLIVQK